MHRYGGQLGPSLYLVVLPVGSQEEDEHPAVGGVFQKQLTGTRALRDGTEQGSAPLPPWSAFPNNHDAPQSHLLKHSFPIPLSADYRHMVSLQQVGLKMLPSLTLKWMQEN